MFRALVISSLVLSFATSVVGCGNGKRGTAIRRAKAGKDKAGTDKTGAKIKASRSGGASEKTAELIKVSGPNCLNMDAVSKSLQSGQDKFTVYTRDADVGVLEHNEDAPTACFSFTSINDKNIRGQHALTRLHPSVSQTFASKLGETNIGSLLKFSGQKECESASFVDTPSAYDVECKTQDSLTLVKTGTDGSITDIRNYQLGDKELVITQYQPVSSNISCDSNKTGNLYTRHVSVIAFDWSDRVELRTAYAQLLEAYVKPKQADLSSAIANAAPVLKKKVQPEEKRPSSSNTLTLKTATYTLLMDSVKNGNVQFPECKNRISEN